MHIIELQVEGFKRLRVLAIRPRGNVVEITGNNAEGKTSTLDAIWAALGGKDASPEKPIHTGADRAEIVVTLGEGSDVKFKVTRKYRLKEGVPFTTDLVVESAEGAKFGSPQGILDQMVGSLCFDPLAFTRLKDEEQITALRAFVPAVDFKAIEAANKRDFEARTDVGRKVRDLKGQLAATPEVAGDVPQRVDVEALETKLGEAARHNNEVMRQRDRRENSERRIAVITDEIEALTKEMQSLQAQLEGAAPIPAPIDIEEVQRKLATGRQTNVLVAKAEQRMGLEDRISDAEDEATELTTSIEKRKDEMAAAVAAAQMPVPGLGFGDGFVTLNGEPFAQASQAEKIRASVAIAAAMNPRLRVARVLDGSLLDAKSWAAIEQYAVEHDLQVWIETVQRHGAAAVVIQDGGVVAPPADDDDVI